MHEMHNTPLRKAKGRAKDAYRLMLTRGIMSVGFTHRHPVGYCWDDTPHGTNIIVHLRPSGGYSHREVIHGSV